MDNQEQPLTVDTVRGFSISMDKKLPALLMGTKVARTLVKMGLSPAEFFDLYQYRHNRTGVEKPLPFSTRELESFKLYFEHRQSHRSFYRLRETLAVGGLCTIKQANKALDRYLRLVEEGRIPDEWLPVMPEE